MLIHIRYIDRRTDGHSAHILYYFIMTMHINTYKHIIYYVNMMSVICWVIIIRSGSTEVIYDHKFELVLYICGLEMYAKHAIFIMWISYFRNLFFFFFLFCCMQLCILDNFFCCIQNMCKKWLQNWAECRGMTLLYVHVQQCLVFFHKVDIKLFLIKSMMAVSRYNVKRQPRKAHKNIMLASWRRSNNRTRFSHQNNFPFICV